MARQKLPATVAVSLALLTTGEHAIAQGASEMQVRLQAGAASSARVDAVMPSSLMQLAPGFSFSSQNVRIDASSQALLDGQQWRIGDALASAEFQTDSYHGLRAELITSANRLMVDPLSVNSQLDITGRLHLVREHAGVYLGSGIVRPLRVGTALNSNVSTGGVWTRLGSTTLRATVTTFLFTKFASNDSAASTTSSVSACPVSTSTAAPDVGETSVMPLSSATVSCRRESRLTDLEGTVHWEHNLLELSVRGGQRFGRRMDVNAASRAWASAQAAYWITDQFAAVAGGGREPAQPIRGLPARNFGSLGVMLAYWPIPRGAVLVETPANLVKAFELRPAGVALQRLTARIGGVERVEIMGDFTDWAPVQLVRRGRDQWELLVPMSPGVHQINMRIDGGKWMAPPGVPTIRDDFSGEVGVLVIKQ